MPSSKTEKAGQHNEREGGVNGSKDREQDMITYAFFYRSIYTHTHACINSDITKYQNRKYLLEPPL